MSDSSLPLLNSEHIKKLLPHRYPFLLVDRVLEFEASKSIKAYKNITVNEPFFNGHFPQKAIMPGVLQIEALAQTAGLLLLKSSDYDEDNPPLFYFAGIDQARFKKMVVPGDQLILTAQVEKSRKQIWKFSCSAYVDDQIACEADIMLIKDKDSD